MKDNNAKEMVGSLKISEDVLATIASLAAIEVSGVAELSAVPVNIRGILKKTHIRKAIRIELNDDVASIDVFIKIKYGSKVQEVADQVQKRIKEAVQNMTGIAVSKVNVYIAGIALDDTAKER